MSKREGIQLCQPFSWDRLAKWGYPLYVQPKLDGERCRVVARFHEPQLLSSQKNLFNSAVPHIVDELRAAGFNGPELDGELYIHGKSFQQLHSIVSRRVNLSDQYHRVELHLFDVADEHASQSARFDILRDVFAKLHSTESSLRLVETRVVNELSELNAAAKDFIDAGYEGIILRYPNAYYERKRSLWVMKLKPTREDTYTIVGSNEEVDKDGFPKGTLGAFVVRGCESETFAVGTGPALTRDQRISLWKDRFALKGRMLRVKYQELSDDQIPRFPVALEVL